MNTILGFKATEKLFKISLMLSDFLQNLNLRELIYIKTTIALWNTFKKVSEAMVICGSFQKQQVQLVNEIFKQL